MENRRNGAGPGAGITGGRGRTGLIGRLLDHGSRGFLDVLKARGLTFFSGVPDSTFQQSYNYMVEDPEVRYVPAVREDVALGVASAAYFAGKLGGVMMQNSGIGNIVNPLTSFSLMYKIPVAAGSRLARLWRSTNDAPEHWIMGVKSPEIFDLLEVPYEIPEPDQLEYALDRLLAEIHRRSVPGALLIRPGVDGIDRPLQGHRENPGACPARRPGVEHHGDDIA